MKEEILRNKGKTWFEAKNFDKKQEEMGKICVKIREVKDKM